MLKYFNEEKIRRVLDEKRAFRLAEATFRLIAQKNTVMPPKIYLNIPSNKKGLSNDFRAMPAFVGGAGERVCGVKWVSVYPENRRFKLPAVSATILLNSAETGVPLAILEGNHITAIRTGAAAAVASHYLANPKPQKLAIIGAGIQAEYQLKALTGRFQFQEISVWGFLKKEADLFCSRHSSRFPGLQAHANIQSCVASADMIVTCTPSRKPILKKQWIKPGAHINAIGADASGKQELDPAIIKNSSVVVDEWEQAAHSGEINVPVSRGLFSKKDLTAELSQVVSGQKKGRRSRDEITVFDSTGLAVLDIYFAKYIYDHYAGAA